MDLYVDDEAFVRAPPALVYRRLAEPSTYGDWWPAFRLRSATPSGATWDAEAIAAGRPSKGEPEGRPPEPGESRLTFDLVTGALRPRLRVEARPYRFRPGKGVFLRVSGDLNGDLEWWLEEGHGGTLVRHLARCDVRRAPARTVRAYRRVLRAALFGLKDVVQSEVRELAGLAP